MEEDLAKLIDTERKGLGPLSRIFIVRHAESIANVHGVFQGISYDTDLSELGKKQAESLARKAREIGIKRIISSPLKRTYQTALEVSRMCNCPIEINELIIETNHGEWEGKEKKEVERLYSELYQIWLSRPSQAVFPRGEAFSLMKQRIEMFLSTTEITDGTMIVTHDNVLRVIVTLANEGNLDDIWKHSIEPASLNFFEVNKVGSVNKLKILELNHTSHLVNLRSDIKNHAL